MDGLMMDRPLLLKTLLWRAEHVFGDNEVVTWADGTAHRSNYRLYASRVRRLAGALRSLGVEAGDRVGTLAWNTGRHFEAYYAVPCMGAVLHTANLRLFPEQIVRTINHAGDKVLLVDPDQLPVVERLWSELTSVEAVVVLSDSAPASTVPAYGYEALMAEASPVSDFPDLPESSAAAICYTSATTGPPKGVVYSHRSMVLHSLGLSLHGTFGVREGMSLLAISPMFHANAWGIPHAAAMQGAKIVFPGVHPAPQTYLELIQAERVTHAFASVTVGMQVRDLLTRAPGEFDLSSLEYFLLGGQAPPRALMEFFDGLGIHVPQGWGMTETSPLACWNDHRPHNPASDADTVYRRRVKNGVPLPLVELKLVDDNGAELPWDGTASGELLVRGPWITSGYYNDPERSAAAVEDGWFRSGDVATIDPRGTVQLVDRLRDLIKSGGEWISSLELENALMAHPAVAEAAVIAIPDDLWLERPLACIVPRDPAEPPPTDDLQGHLTEHFPKWWLPDRYEILADIPKTGVGKCDKNALRLRFGTVIT